MREDQFITVISNRKQIVLNVSSILYVLKADKLTEIHVSGGGIYETRTPLGQLEEKLGEAFIKVHRGCLVSAMAIHDITDRINLVDGQALEYTARKKSEIIARFRSWQQQMICSFREASIPTTAEEYRIHYRSFDGLPFAFTDIEMVFDEERRAVDWIFRYGNPALAKLEKLPLEQMIGRSFGSLFSNMDAKWLRSYERAVLYGETLEIIDYSPEIDAELKVICFPTFPGHCGCILFDQREIRLAQNGKG
ncbi:MAG: LytTR family transcriptional regulator DNA-binding domain-containing protein [Candidatus Limivicinus sp.]